MNRRAFIAAAALAPLFANGITRLDGLSRRAPMNLVVEGDSLNTGSGLPPGGCEQTNTCPQSWPNQMRAELPGGDLTYQAFASDHATITNEINARAAAVNAAFIPGKINVLTLWAGTNDIMLLGLTGRQAYEAYATYIAAALAARPWAAVFPFTIAPRQPRTPTISIEKFESERQSFNSLVRGNMSPHLVDVAADERIGKKYANLDWTYFFDGTHMTPAGYAIVKDLVLLQLMGV